MEHIPTIPAKLRQAVAHLAVPKATMEDVRLPCSINDHTAPAQRAWLLLVGDLKRGGWAQLVRQVDHFLGGFDVACGICSLALDSHTLLLITLVFLSPT
jgi:hypothetical protein